MDLTNALTPEQFKYVDMIVFYFHLDNVSSAEIMIEDRLSSLDRDNPEAKRGFSGPVIEKKLDKGMYSKYAAEFSQTVFVEESTD